MVGRATLFAISLAGIRLRPTLWDYPSIFRYVHTLAIDSDAFRLKQAPLEARLRLSYQQAPTCANYAMPRDTFPVGTSCHSVPGSSCAAAQAERFRQRSTRGYTTSRNFLHQPVNRIPRRHRALPV